jgi:hypothetical protein
VLALVAGAAIGSSLMVLGGDRTVRPRRRRPSVEESASLTLADDYAAALQSPTATPSDPERGAGNEALVGADRPPAVAGRERRDSGDPRGAALPRADREPRPEAGPPPLDRAPEEMRPNLSPLADRLGVTGEARQRFIATQEQFVSRMREQRFRLMQLQAELRAALLAEHPDRERIDAITRQLGEDLLGRRIERWRRASSRRATSSRRRSRSGS